ncbi:hypothetical protein ACNQF7_03820 [Flavobacterium sp. RSP29]|uniref:hypothetical protein n=1 Tax=Flavobacterium sp. RSP29 TaxID=3401731 RepID=UPI003AAF3230
MKTTIKELQIKGFKKTTVKGLFLTNNGKAYNYTTGNDIKPRTTGKVIINGKEHNLLKLILETFGKIPIRNGKVLFLNGNDQDFYYKNLAYAVGTHYKAPTETNLINCIRLYFAVEENFNRNNVFYKSHLEYIATKRGFIHLHSLKEFDLFLEWIKPLSQSKPEISKKHGYTVINGTNAINKYLVLLVNECLQDQENGLLQIIDFAPKPLTATEKNKKANETLKNMGSKVKIPLRKKDPNKFNGF